jgi:DNA end-binding protein Ku
MAKQLIASLESKWDPEKYTDEYKENLMRVINAKVKGKTPKLIAEDHGPKQADVVDLMARLRASLEGKKAPAAKSGRKKTSRRKPAA